MKALLVSLVLLVAVPAFAETAAKKGAWKAEGERLENIKKRLVDSLEERRRYLDDEIVCVKAAQSADAVQSCRDEAEKKRAEWEERRKAEHAKPIRPKSAADKK